MPILTRFTLLLSAVIALTNCSTEKQPQDTLRAIDTHQEKSTATAEVFVKPKSEEDIKNAYYNYIKNAPSDDKTRRLAINRLTELEMSRLNTISKNGNGNNDLNDDPQYLESLQKSLSLLEQSLKDYPDAKDNDKTLYQIARIKDQLGQHEESISALRQLCQKYPRSPRYAEAQFRLGEFSFIQGDYIAAEAAYSEVAFATAGDEFYERALFKRGWTRFKQGLFSDAADDYVAALDKHQFADYETLSPSDKDQYNEYFRALGLSLSSLQNSNELQQYFASKSDFKYLFHSYEIISRLYLEQERYSDAATAIEQFIADNPKSTQIPRAQLTILEAWKQGKFRNRFEDALSNAFTQYGQNSSYWSHNKDTAEQEKFFTDLREYVLTAAIYFQEDYQQTHNKNDFEKASLWYKRYLENYSHYARQDKVYGMYAELLASQAQLKDAIHFFELAAYDGDIILDKEAAYSTIVETSKLYEQDSSNATWLEKHIHYTLISAQLYQTETRYQIAALHAAELALNNNLYDQSVALASTLPDSSNDALLYQANVIKGVAYLQAKSFVQAESIFSDLLKQNRTPIEQRKLQDHLATAIYKEGENEAANNHIDIAIQQYARVAKSTPTSEIAPKSLYEAIVLAMKHEQWNIAVGLIQEFQQLYPKHELYKDTTRQLSLAYLNAGEGVKAAQTFEKISASEENQDVKMATIWKAAELYESKHNYDAAIHSYRNYVDNFPRPYPQYIEGMYKLTQLYTETKEMDKVISWQEKIASTDKQTVKTVKTERTNYITATVLLDTAKRVRTQFELVRLVEPLQDNLRTKKKLMQDAIASYGQASTYNYPDIITEATYSIGNIYQTFSTSLAKSERPKNLKGEELEQYNILIEDQAFPFEEKAIEFYEINMAHTKEGIANTWISQSFSSLEKLYPVRYSKKGKAEAYQHE